MVKFINRHTGGEMWVSEDKVEKYKAAGHKLAASAFVPVKVEKPTSKKPTTKKKR